MRLINIDDYAASNETGKTAVLKALEKWEREHPLTEIKLEETEDYVTFVRKEENKWTIYLKRKTAGAAPEED